MKASRILITVFSFGTILTFSGCGKSSPGETISEKQFDLLSTKTWSVANGGSVSLGGVDQTSTWSGFTLTISGTKTASTFSYVCTGRPALGPWPAGGGASGLGTWAFGTDPTTQIIRDPNDTNGNTLPMTYTVTAASGSTAATLQISFTFTPTSSNPGYTRTSNVGGAWVFNLR
jgi:hypothetical protein